MKSVREIFSDVAGKAVEKMSKWEIFAMSTETIEMSFDDSPVTKEWVQERVSKLEASPFKYKITGQFDGLMNAMLWRASCNGYEDIVRDILNKYESRIDADVAGHSFWCAAIDSDVGIMEALAEKFGDKIKDSDFGEALGRGAYSEEGVAVIEYLHDNYADKITGQAIGSALHNAAAFACTTTMEKLFDCWSDKISAEDVEGALAVSKRQRDFYEDRYDYDAAEAFLSEKQAALSTPEVISPKREPKP